MRRALVVVAFVVFAVAAAVIVVQPTVVKAGHTTGLVGRTHLIVKEHNLKVLRASGDGGLRELSRNGVLSSSNYVVPAGRVFVATDMLVKVSSCGSLVGSGTFCLLGLPDGVDRWCAFFPGGASPDFLVVESNLSGGVVFDSGSSMGIGSGAPCTIGSVPAEVTVLGYETVDV